MKTIGKVKFDILNTVNEEGLITYAELAAKLFRPEDDIRNKFLPFINVDTNKVNVIYKFHKIS